jgi:hypothetical protein
MLILIRTKLCSGTLQELATTIESLENLYTGKKVDT